MVHRAIRILSIVALIAWSAGATTSAAEPDPPDVTEPPPRDQFLVLPLRIHILTASDLPEIDCHLTDVDIARIVGKVNGIWHKAGIHWGLESIVREPAARTDAFRLARDLDSSPNLGIFAALIPDSTRRFDGLHVYYIHKFPVNGVWMGRDFAIVQETAQLRKVEGGIDEPVPRVTAHELGHALGLPHRQARTNLLASGTTGTLLNADEVATARRNAPGRKGTSTIDELTRRAEAEVREGRIGPAMLLWKWLSEVPGEGADRASKRLAELEAGKRTGAGKEAQ